MRIEFYEMIIHLELRNIRTINNITFFLSSTSLSEYSDENMMEAYNLAICFGPTLLPIPPDRDQVSYQASVNEIIKTIIVHQEDIFPNDGGEVYEKCILENTRWVEDLCFLLRLTESMFQSLD